MKKKIGIILSLIVVAMLSVVPSSNSQVKHIIGAVAQCDTAIAGCVPFPASVATTCNTVLNAATCPQFFHPSWSNGNRLWGVSTTNAAACVTSVDVGATWSVCTAQAFVQIQQNIAEASDGTIIAVADIAGTCTVKTSPDNAATWNTVFTSPAVQCGGIGSSSNAQMLYCQSSGGQCDFGDGALLKTYRSTNNGANWTVSTLGDGLAKIGFNIEMSSALIGGFGGSINTGTKSMSESAGLFQVSVAWPGTAAGYLGSYAFMFNGVVQYISNNGDAIYKRTDIDGNVIQNITPTGILTACVVANPCLRPINWSGGIYYLIGPVATGTGVWISTDSFSTYTLLSTLTTGGYNNPTSARYTMYKVGSRILISSTVGNFLRIS